MADDNRGLTKGLLIGFLAGGVVGALAALLYAPKSGKELRADIKRKANDIAEGASDYIQTARTKSVEIVNEGKERSDQLIAETKEKAEHLLGNAEKVLSGIRQRAAEEPGKVKAAFRAGFDAYKMEKEKNKS
jgi:gas vesicle protein